jgi:hypothetical protein
MGERIGCNSIVLTFRLEQLRLCRCLFFVVILSRKRRTSVLDTGLRSTCRDDTATPPRAHALFDAIHRNFPQSIWAEKYPTWE